MSPDWIREYSKEDRKLEKTATQTPAQLTSAFSWEPREHLELVSSTELKDRCH